MPVHVVDESSSARVRAVVDSFAELTARGTSAGLGQWSDEPVRFIVTAGEPGPLRGYPPTSGPLAHLPMGAGIKLLQSSDGSVMLEWPDAGRLIAHLGGDEFRLVLDDRADDAGWMVGCLLGSLQHLVGGVRGIHGALVEMEGQHVLICGASGSGKSTLALLVACFGGHLLVEDFCYLNAVGEAATVGVRDFVTLRPGTWNWLAPHLRRWLTDNDSVPDSTASRPIDEYRRGRAGQVRLSQRHLPRPASSGPVRIDAVLLPSIDPHGAALAGHETSRGAADAIMDEATDLRMMSWMRPLLSFDPPPNRIVLPESVRFFKVVLGISASPAETYTALRDILVAPPLSQKGRHLASGTLRDLRRA